MGDIRITQQIVGDLLDRISDQFKAPKLTLIVRTPGGERFPGAQDFVMTSDTLEEAIAVLQRRVEVPTTPPADARGSGTGEGA